MIGIQISDNNGTFLTVELPDILGCLKSGDNFHWSILYFEAVGDLSAFGTNVLELEKAAYKSPTGVEVTWETLTAMAGVFHQIIDIILIGCHTREQVRKFDDDAEMYRSCEYVIELVDTSYSLVHSHDEAFIDCLVAKFQDVKYLHDE